MYVFLDFDLGSKQICSLRFVTEQLLSHYTVISFYVNVK